MAIILDLEVLILAGETLVEVKDPAVVGLLEGPVAAVPVGTRVSGTFAREVQSVP